MSSSRSSSGRKGKSVRSRGGRSFKQKVSRIFRLWDTNDYSAALHEVESLLETWPGNAQLYILWASLVQLQKNPTHNLQDVKQALQQANDLGNFSAEGAIELGNFLDNVEDNPSAASKVFAEAIAQARRQLIEALIGQAKALLQIDKREESLKCLLELLYLTETASNGTRSKAADATPDIIFRSLSGQVLAIQLKGPYATQIEELVNEVLVNRPA